MAVTEPDDDPAEKSLAVVEPDIEDEDLKFAIIRDLYNTDDYTTAILEEQLEGALESQVEYIIIEPNLIGEDSSKWIKVGNFLHKSAVMSGFTCLLTPIFCPYKFQKYLLVPSATINLVFVALYNFSWQYDPCCKYQVERNSRIIERLQLQTLSNTLPSVVLVRRDDHYRKRLHNMFSIGVLTYISWKGLRFCFS